MKELKILLVDDEHEFVTTLAERLEIRNLSVSVAMDGETALGIVEKDLPQVIVLDVMMPGLNGLDVLERIKSIDKRIQVILLSGHGATKDGIKGLKLGAFDFLIKPIDIDELIIKINEGWNKYCESE
jgi:DNA-binding response OmpR family regulator